MEIGTTNLKELTADWRSATTKKESDGDDTVEAETEVTAMEVEGVVRVIEIVKEVSHREGVEGTEAGAKVVMLVRVTSQMLVTQVEQEDIGRKEVVSLKAPILKVLMAATKALERRKEVKRTTVVTILMRMLPEEKRKVVLAEEIDLELEVRNPMIAGILRKKEGEEEERRKGTTMMMMRANTVEAGVGEKVDGKAEKDRMVEVGRTAMIVLAVNGEHEKERRKAVVAMTAIVGAKVRLEMDEEEKRRREGKEDTALVPVTMAVITLMIVEENTEVGGEKRKG